MDRISGADCHRFVSTRISILLLNWKLLFRVTVLSGTILVSILKLLCISFNCRSHTFCVCLPSTAFTNKDNLLAPFLFLKPPSFFASESLSNFSVPQPPTTCPNENTRPTTPPVPVRFPSPLPPSPPPPPPRRPANPANG